MTKVYSYSSYTCVIDTKSKECRKTVQKALIQCSIFQNFTLGSWLVLHLQYEKSQWRALAICWIFGVLHLVFDIWHLQSTLIETTPNWVVLDTVYMFRTVSMTSHSFLLLIHPFTFVCICVYKVVEIVRLLVKFYCIVGTRSTSISLHSH